MVIPCLLGFAVMTMVAAAPLTRCGEGAREELEALVERVAARDAIERVPVQREVRHVGPMRDGVANVYYAIAVESAKAVRPLVAKAKLWALRDQDLPLEREDVVALRAAWRPSLQALLDGARCRTLVFDVRWDGFWTLDLSAVVSCESACLAQEGSSAAAAQLWCSAARLIVDLELVEGPVWAPSCVRQMLPWWGDRLLATADSSLLRAIDDAAQDLDVAFDASIDVERELAGRARFVLRDDYYASGLWHRPPSVEDCLRAWYAGFSPQRAAMVELLWDVRTSDQIAAPAAPWQRRVEQLEHYGSNGHLDLAHWLQVEEMGRRQAQAQLRLLRMAIAFHLGESLEPLQDPLGDGPLVVDDRGATVVMRSAGNAERVVTR